jgi:hypothetical protein
LFICLFLEISFLKIKYNKKEKIKLKKNSKLTIKKIFKRKKNKKTFLLTYKMGWFTNKNNNKDSNNNNNSEDNEN